MLFFRFLLVFCSLPFIVLCCTIQVSFSAPLPHEFFLQSLNVEVKTTTNASSPSLASANLVGNETLIVKAVVDVLVFGTSLSSSSTSSSTALSLFKSSSSSVFLSRRDASTRTFYQSPGGTIEPIFGSSPTQSVSTSDYETWTSTTSGNNGGGIELKISSALPLFQTSASATTPSNFDSHPIKISFDRQTTSNMILDTFYNAFERAQVVASGFSSPECQSQNNNKFKCCSHPQGNSSSQTIAYSLDYNFSDPILCSRETFSTTSAASSKISISSDININVEAIINGNQQLVNQTARLKVLDSSFSSNNEEKLQQSFSTTTASTSSSSSATILLNLQKQSLSSTGTSILDSLRSAIVDASSPLLEKRFCFHRFASSTSSSSKSTSTLISLQPFVAPNSTTFGPSRNRLGYFSDTFALQDKQCDQPGVFYTAIYVPPSNKVDPLNQLSAIYDRYLISNSMTLMSQISSSSSSSLTESCEMVSANFSEDATQNSNLRLYSAEFACNERKNFQLEIDAEIKVDGGLKRLFPINIVADSFAQVEIENHSTTKIANDNSFFSSSTLSLSFCLDISNRGFGVPTPSGSLLFQIKSFSCSKDLKKTAQSLFSYNSSCPFSLQQTTSFIIEPSPRPQIDQYTTQRFCLRGLKTEMQTDISFDNSNENTSRLLDLLRVNSLEDTLVIKESLLTIFFDGSVLIELQDLAAKVNTQIPITWNSPSVSFSTALSSQQQPTSFINNRKFLHSYVENCSFSTFSPLNYTCSSPLLNISNASLLCRSLYDLEFNASSQQCQFENFIDYSSEYENNDTSKESLFNITVPVCEKQQEISSATTFLPGSAICWFESSSSSSSLVTNPILCPGALFTTPQKPSSNVNTLLATKLSTLEQEIRSSTFVFNLTVLRNLNNHIQQSVIERQQQEVAEIQNRHAAAAFFLALDVLLIVLVIFYFVSKNSPQLQKKLHLEEFFERIEQFQQEQREKRAVSTSTTAIEESSSNSPREKSPHSPFHRFGSKSPSPSPKHHKLNIDSSPSPIPTRKRFGFWNSLQEYCVDFTIWCSQVSDSIGKWFSELKNKISEWCERPAEKEPSSEKHQRAASSRKKTCDSVAHKRVTSEQKPNAVPQNDEDHIRKGRRSISKRSAVIENQPRENFFLQSFNNNGNYNFETASLPPATELDFEVPQQKKASSHRSNSRPSSFRSSDSVRHYHHNEERNISKKHHQNSVSRNHPRNNNSKRASSAVSSSSAVTGGWSAADLTSEVIPVHQQNPNMKASIARSDLSLFLQTSSNHQQQQQRSSSKRRQEASFEFNSNVVPNFQLSSTRKSSRSINNLEQQQQAILMTVESTTNATLLKTNTSATTTKKSSKKRASSSSGNSSSSSSRRRQQQYFFENFSNNNNSNYYFNENDGDGNDNDDTGTDDCSVG